MLALPREKGHLAGNYYFEKKHYLDFYCLLKVLLLRLDAMRFAGGEGQLPRPLPSDAAAAAGPQEDAGGPGRRALLRDAPEPSRRLPDGAEGKDLLFRTDFKSFSGNALRSFSRFFRTRETAVILASILSPSLNLCTFRQKLLKSKP